MGNLKDVEKLPEIPCRIAEKHQQQTRQNAKDLSSERRNGEF